MNYEIHPLVLAVVPKGEPMKVSATVYMTLKVEVRVGDWEAAQPFEQLHKQAEREARAALDRVLDQSGIRVLPDNAVMHVITREKKNG